MLPTSRLRCLNDEFFATPCQAVVCLLKDIQAGGDEWSPDAVGLVENFTSERFVFEIFLVFLYLDFLVSGNANALDDKHFSSNAGDAMCGRGDAMCGRGETKYRTSERSLCQISHDICTKGTITVPSVKTGQGDGRA